MPIHQGKRAWGKTTHSKEQARQTRKHNKLAESIRVLQNDHLKGQIVRLIDCPLK